MKDILEILNVLYGNDYADLLPGRMKTLIGGITMRDMLELTDEEIKTLISFYRFVLYCIALYCMVLCCIVLCCVVLYCIGLYCIVLYCIVLYCIVLYCLVLYCIM